MDEQRHGFSKAGTRSKKSTDGRARSPQRNANPTLHQLRIFWAVAHSETLTNAAKQLGLAQPSLSQQLGRLETNVGTLLFHRRSNEMEITEAGKYLLPKVEQILRILNEAEDGLAQFSGGQRLALRLAGVNSILRIPLPPVLRSVAHTKMHVRLHAKPSPPTPKKQTILNVCIYLLEFLYCSQRGLTANAGNQEHDGPVRRVQRRGWSRSHCGGG